VANRREDVAGEFIRDNIVEKEIGINLALDLQVLDIETCEPVANKYLEIWRESLTYSTWNVNVLTW